MPIATSLPVSIWLRNSGQLPNIIVTWPPSRSVIAGPWPFVRDVDQVEPGLLLQHLAGEMRRRAVAERRVGQRLRGRPSPRARCAQVGDRRQAAARPGCEHVLGHSHQRDRSQVAERVVGQLVRIECLVGGEAVRDRDEAVAVGSRARDVVDADHRARPGPVLDDHRLAERACPAFDGHETRDVVGRAAGRKRHDDANRSRAEGHDALWRSHVAARMRHGRSCRPRALRRRDVGPITACPSAGYDASPATPPRSSARGRPRSSTCRLPDPCPRPSCRRTAGAGRARSGC